MNTSLWIWTGFHFMALVGTFFSKKPDSSATAAMVVITWLAFGAMLWTGHTGWFLWTNIPLILIMALSGLSHLTKPPNTNNEEEASRALWSVAVRLAVVLSCWILA